MLSASNAFFFLTSGLFLFLWLSERAGRESDRKAYYEIFPMIGGLIEEIKIFNGILPELIPDLVARLIDKKT